MRMFPRNKRKARHSKVPSATLSHRNQWLGFTRALATTLCLAVALIAAAGVAAEESRQPQAELDAVTAAIDDIQNWLDTAAATYSREETDLRDAELQVTRTLQSIAATERGLAALQSQLQDLQEQRQRLEADKAAQLQQLAQVVRAAYVAGDQSLLKLLLNQEDINKSARLLHYYQIFSEAQLDVLNTFQSTLDEITRVNAELLTATADLTRQQSALQQQLATLEQASRSKQLALAALAESISARNTELETLQANQQALQQLIEEINRAIERIPVTAEYTPIDERRGRLPLPLPGPIAQEFGSRYGDGNLRRQGVLIASETGTPVQAIHPGRVVFADWLRGSGLLIIVDHGDGYMSLYGNNESLLRAAGDRVNGGDVLATSGGRDSDNATGLYFEIRHHGNPENPADWLQSGNQ